MLDRESTSHAAILQGTDLLYAYRGKYDREYIDYTVALLRKCKEHGFLVYMDPHQDLVRVLAVSSESYWLTPPLAVVSFLRRIRCALLDSHRLRSRAPKLHGHQRVVH